MKRISRFMLVALLIWLASLLGLAWTLSILRDRMVASLSTPESQASWEQWREEVKRAQAEDSPVQRRIPKSEEPPALIMMRDRFPVILTGALVTWTFFYGFTIVIVRGLLVSRKAPTATRGSAAL